MRTITLIPGDGIGPEVTDAMVRVVEASGAQVAWERVDAGTAAIKRCGNSLPDETIASILKNRLAGKGPTEIPEDENFRSANVELRKRFNLFGNVRPIRSFKGVASRYSDINLVVIRENIEDIYIGEEKYLNRERTVAEAISRISLEGSARLMDFAARYAVRNSRKKLTAVHKANILKFTHGLFLAAYTTRARLDQPVLNWQKKIADNMAMQLVLNPHQFDVIVAPNMIGDILSDLCAGLVGGLGVAPGMNVGEDCVMFEAVHGTAPDIAGQNKANPTAIILSAAMMLEHIGEVGAAKLIRRAVEDVIAEGQYITSDLIVSANAFDPLALILAACEALEFVGENQSAGEIKKIVHRIMTRGRNNANVAAGVGTTRMADAIIEKIRELKDWNAKMRCQ